MGGLTRCCTPLEVHRTLVRTAALLYCCSTYWLECLVSGWVGWLAGGWLGGWVAVVSCVGECVRACGMGSCYFLWYNNNSTLFSPLYNRPALAKSEYETTRPFVAVLL